MNQIEISPELASTYRAFKTIVAHTEGEPLRIITAGYPEVDRKSVV